MAVPPGLSSDITAFLQTLEDRVFSLEAPKGFEPAYLTTSASLTTASAAKAGGKWAIITDLKTVAWSDGVHWFRADTGATIV
jgi:hypothetical protein